MIVIYFLFEILFFFVHYQWYIVVDKDNVCFFVKKLFF